MYTRHQKSVAGVITESGNVHSEHPDCRMYRIARWCGLLCFIMCLMGQEVKQQKGLTQESQELVRIHPESEGDKGIFTYSVMEAEKPVRDECRTRI